jgi:DNA-nicking Smr family endonuclease
MRRMKGKERDLTVEERELWRAVTATIQPLHGRALGSQQPSDSRSRHLPEPSPPAEARKGLANGPRPLGVIDRRLKRELTKGRLEIDARLDLHGFRVGEAHARVMDFLLRSREGGARVVLIVTGKGSRPNPHQRQALESEIGILKRQTPLWLADPRLRHIVAAFGEAAQTHGGQGALYVRLRRK